MTVQNQEKQEKAAKVAKETKKKALELEKYDKETIQKYARGNVDFVPKKKTGLGLQARIKHTNQHIFDSATATAAAEILLPSDAGCIELDDNRMKVYKLKQKEIVQNVDLNTARNVIDFQLHDFAPYTVNYSRNGRHLLLGGRRGHVATYDCQTMSIGTELQLQQEVFDVQYLHNETLFAVAQQKYAYIYDSKGVEIHCLKNHERPIKLDYLPYHFLLVTGAHSGWIKWQDISVGEYVAGYQTGHGPIRAMKQNPFNAVMHVGHSNGVVSLWSPSAGKSLVSMFCHKAAITDVAIDREGHYMATTALDGFLKVWDLRKLSPIHTYKLNKPGTTLDISERGMIGVGLGRHVQILKNAFTNPMDITYLEHEIRTPNVALSSGGGAVAATKALLSRVAVNNIAFRPLEDLLCIGHSHGISSMIVPGSGEPNFDSFENNPFATLKQRREAEVQNLLNKLQPEMIGLDNNALGSLDKDPKQLQTEHKNMFYEANKKELAKKDKNRKRGRNKISAKLRRKQKNVIDEQLVKLKEKKKEIAQQKESEKKKKRDPTFEEKKTSALSRFS